VPIIQKETQAWFDYPDDEFGGKALIRLPKGGELKSIREKTSEVATYAVKAFRETETVFRQRGHREAVAVAVVKDWQNFFDMEHKPLECNRANILMMCQETGFHEFIDECLAQLEKQAEEKAKAEVKN